MQRPQRANHMGPTCVLASMCCQNLPCSPTYLVRTMETASLRMLSPNTSMLSTGSTCSALKIAIVATGSTADIREPNAKLQGEKQADSVKHGAGSTCQDGS